MQLQEAVAQLQGVVASMSGAAQVQAGGPGQSPAQVPGGGCGCGCAGGGTSPGDDRYDAPPGPAPADSGPSTSRGPDSGGGDVRRKIVQIAQQEHAKKVREDAGSDRDSGGNIVKYRRAVTGPGEDPNTAEPWCADFASWVLKQAGAPIGQGGRGEDYVPALRSWAQKNGHWHQATPKPGDLVVYDWAGDDTPDHVAVVVKVEGGQITSIGGNESDAIGTNTYPVGSSKIVGYVTPPGA